MASAGAVVFTDGVSSVVGKRFNASNGRLEIELRASSVAEPSERLQRSQQRASRERPADECGNGALGRLGQRAVRADQAQAGRSDVSEQGPVAMLELAQPRLGLQDG